MIEFLAAMVVSMSVAWLVSRLAAAGKERLAEQPVEIEVQRPRRRR
jgi:hypothetical protein